MTRTWNVRFSTDVWRTQSDNIQNSLLLLLESTIVNAHIQRDNKIARCACALREKFTFRIGSLSGCATANTTAKMAEATDQTTGRYLLEMTSQTTNQVTDQILLLIVFIISHTAHRSLEWPFLSFRLVVF